MERTKITIVETDINSLKPNNWNTNIVSPENELKIEHSLNKFGLFRPIIVRTLKNGTLEILGGEHRWSVAKKLGYTSIPVVNLGKVDDIKAKEVGLVDNGRYGEDDTLQLASLLKEIGDVDDVLSFLPYSHSELDNIFSASSIELDELDIPDDDGHAMLPPIASAQTHQIMRFKIPIEDAEFMQNLIESVMKSQGFLKDDSMLNAGHALIHICRK